MQDPKSFLGPMRLPFLVLPPACVLLGAGTALWTQGSISILYLVLAFVGAVSAHISVNALNEYFDFGSGLDSRTVRTPFSGGSGTLQAKPETARTALTMGLVTLAITALIGLFFLYVWGWAILPLGLLGLLVIVAYTPWVTHYPLLCLITPGLGFGLLMVMGTDFVLSGSYSSTSLVASLVPFFLVSDLLLLNQFPDVEADRGVGRHHFPIAVGKEASVKLYVAFLAGSYLAIIFGYIAGSLPLEGLLALGSILLAVPTARGVARFANDVPSLVPYMGRNVIVIVMTPVLLAIGLFIGR